MSDKTVPKVSIIIRTQNRPLLLSRAVKSVLNQTYNDWVCVIVNDGGPVAINERTLKISLGNVVKKFFLIHNPTALGRSRAANQGIEKINSTYVAFLDDDDTWEPEFLSQTVHFLEKIDIQNHYGAVASSIVEVYEKIEGDQIHTLKKRRFRKQRTEMRLWDLAIHNYFPLSCALIRRSALKKVGFVNEELHFLEDWDLYLRIAREYEIEILPSPLYNYHFRMSTKDVYDNTVSKKSHCCLLSDTYLRNKYLREDLEKGRMGLGMLMNVVYEMHENGLFSRFAVNLRKVKASLSNFLVSLKDLW